MSFFLKPAQSTLIRSTCPAVHRQHLLPDEFNCSWPSEHLMFGFVDRSHPAHAEDVFDVVAIESRVEIAEGRVELLEMLDVDLVGEASLAGLVVVALIEVHELLSVPPVGQELLQVLLLLRVEAAEAAQADSTGDLGVAKTVPRGSFVDLRV